MRGLLLFFVVLCGIGIGWNFADAKQQRLIKKWLRQNLWVVLFALAAIGGAIVVSINTTMRFL